MPGLSQLKKFNSDILEIGDEVSLREQRGERPVTVELPGDIPDVDDSEDFAMGMPEAADDGAGGSPELPADFDEGPSGSAEDGVPAQPEAADESAGIDVPDLSSLLGGGPASDDDGMPDLSLFSEPSDVPEETDIADLGLESLFNDEAGGGSVGADVPPAEVHDESDPGMAQLLSTDGGELFDLPEFDDGGFEDAPSDGGAEFPEDTDWLDAVASAGTDDAAGLPAAEPPSDAGAGGLEELSADSGALEDALPAEGLEFPAEPAAPDAGTAAELTAAELPSDAGIGEPAALSDDVLEPLEELNADGIVPDEDIFSGQSFTADDFPELSEAAKADIPPSVPEDAADAQPEDVAPSEPAPAASDDDGAFSLDDLDIEGLSFEDAAGTDMFAPPDAAGTADERSGAQPPGPDASAGLPPEQESSTAAEQDVPDLSDFGEIEEFVPSEASSAAGNLGQAFGGAEGAPADSDGGDEFSLPEEDSPVGGEFSLPEEGSSADGGFSLPGEEPPADDGFSLPEEDSPIGGAAEPFDFDSLDLPDGGAASDGAAADDAFPSDFNLDDIPDVGAEPDSSGAEDAAPLETFDTSELEGMDFSIPDSDGQPASAEKTDFELGDADDFKLDNLDFEIPGFSDVQAAEGKAKAHPSAGDNPLGGELPPNTLSDEQFDVFLQNLSEYPLNVRIAVEELMIKNEFTDEAEFEIVCKVLKKVPARQLASDLEKMLDISISVPRNFERRTAAEYEAYKSSFEYQLRNKIIPGALLCALAVVVGFLLFLFAKNFIYKPARAASLYRQGYELLEQSDYPQSELKFEAATKYQMRKNWFFKYARGYREHKQYTRAEQMYRNILYCFKFDKAAGLEYAEMELNDLANYEMAEQILLRDVLDHHINDADGLLLLGDTYLEWATEKDPSKFEDARLQYVELISLYGQTDVNMSRMMRYFIRMDNLLEVLELKERFLPKPKSLGAQDWTELSGYLLDKLYGPLPPADEYLRTKIEDVKDMLTLAVKADAANPVALYNLARYHVFMNNGPSAKSVLESAIGAFQKTDHMHRRDLYKFIDSYRLLGERYAADKEFLTAQEWYTDGIALYVREHDGSGFEGNWQVGTLYADMGDIDYFISGNLDSALSNYVKSVETFNDTPQVRYKIGYIQYGKKNYAEALGSFMKAGEEHPSDAHLLLSMGNTLSLRNDNFAAQGYYERLLEILEAQKEQKGILFPQVRSDEAEIVDSYMKASNNLGVTLY
ncbi:MAG: hypothetical protein K2H09_04640, partial [Treponemataceae bacterium]|nr:hypothetical protein [Treponemataceae bacterium]